MHRSDGTLRDVTGSKMLKINALKSKLLNAITESKNSEQNHSHWYWIVGSAFAFAVIFTSGYVSHHLTADFWHSKSQPALAAAVDGKHNSGNGYSNGTCNVADDGKLFKADNAGNNSCEAGQSGAMSCLIQPVANSCTISQGQLCHADLEIAKTAWKYFENNYNEETGLVNAVDNYPSTTMWDTGSALAATITAHDLGLIDSRTFDQRIMAMFKTLSTMQLFNDEAPNKVYNTNTIQMVDYGNQPTDAGIGVSILDLARLVSWLNTLQCMHPQYHNAVNTSLSRWDYSRLIKDGSMYGMARGAGEGDGKGEEIRVLQEGRLGYEQYAAKILQHVGFDLSVAADYENEFRTNTDILGVSIAHDMRDPRQLGANNYVVTESYAMDAMELGIDDVNRELLKNIFEVQKRRWQKTGIVTAISEDNIDQEPWFLYNSIFNAGLAWQTTNSSNTSFDHLKSVSVKAAISMAMLFPDDEYSHVLTNAIQHAYDPDKGWYSGIYENGAGYNKAFTANTNGVVLAGMLHKKYGPLIPHCSRCSRPIKIESPLLEKEEHESCKTCTVIQADSSN